MKRAILLLFFLTTFSILSFAAGFDIYECETCCDETGTFHLGFEGLYVKPGSSTLLSALDVVTDGNNNTFGRSYGIDPHAHWGYHADIAYAMPCDYPDFYLGWTHVLAQDSKARRQISGSLFGNNLGGVTPLNINGFALGIGRGRIDSEYTDADLLIGKQLTPQKRYKIHSSVGLRYANLTVQDRGEYSLNGNLIGYGQIDNNFCGLGPRVAVDTAIDLMRGMHLIARAAGSMLTGNYHYKYATYNTNGTVGTQGSTVLKGTENHLIVPEADYRAALSYTYEFMPKTSLGIELGWTAVYYFDVLDKSRSRFTTTSGAMSDWSYQGPYLRLQFNFL